MTDRIFNVKVGPNSRGLGVKIRVSDGPSLLLLDGNRAHSRLQMARLIFGTTYDARAKEGLYVLDEAIRQPFSKGGETLLKILRMAGLEISYDEAYAENLREEMRRLQARYTRTLPVPQPDGSLEWERVPGTIAEEDLAKTRAALDYLGWDKFLFPYAYDGVAEMATKRDVLIAMAMGTGKTRASLALSEVHRYLEDTTGPTVIIGLRKHLISWEEEFKKIDLLRATYGERPYELVLDKDDWPLFDKPFSIISLDWLKRDQRRIDAVAEGAKDGQIIVDEIYVASNEASMQSRALVQLSAKHHIGLSGSPLRGYPDSGFIPFAWTLRGGSAALPDYPLDRQGSQRRWNAKFVSYARDPSGGRKKIPLLKNEEEFYAMVEPLMYRRLRNEPELVAVLGDLLMEREVVEVELDEDHKRFYLAVLKRFTDWYKREVRRRQKAGEKTAIPQSEILIKLGFLIRGVSTPWRMKDPKVTLGSEDDDFVWPEYKRKPTAILEAAMSRAIKEVNEGYQVIIFADNRDGLEVMRETLISAGVACEVLHGLVPHNQRADVIDRFRNGRFNVLLASYGVAAEGLNLACASRVIFTEYNWSPSTVRQAEARIARPDQQYTPKAIYITAPGTIQDYVRKLGALKQESMDAGLDRIAQTSGDEDIPDVQQYAASLVGDFEADPEQVAPRQYEIEPDMLLY